jgi:hypothetical protein
MLLRVRDFDDNWFLVGEFSITLEIAGGSGERVGVIHFPSLQQKDEDSPCNKGAWHKGHVVVHRGGRHRLRCSEE